MRVSASRERQNRMRQHSGEQALFYILDTRCSQKRNGGRLLTERDIIIRAIRRKHARDRQLQLLLLAIAFFSLAGAICWRWLGAP